MPKSKAAAKAKAATKLPTKVNKASKAIKKTAPAEGGMKSDRKKNRMKPGTVTLREIKKYQRTVNMLLPRASFQRLVRSITMEMDH